MSNQCTVYATASENANILGFNSKTFIQKLPDVIYRL